jgi:hypothetical protein
MNESYILSTLGPENVSPISLDEVDKIIEEKER